MPARRVVAQLAVAFAGHVAAFAPEVAVHVLRTDLFVAGAVVAVEVSGRSAGVWKHLRHASVALDEDRWVRR